MELVSRITPQEGGKKIFIEPLQAAYLDERSGERREIQYNTKLMLQKVEVS